jgi:hypothetical protein
MEIDKEFAQAFRQEFKELTNTLIWQNDNGDYEVFDRYRIARAHPGYQVFCSATDVGIFTTTKTALSWCIADKNQAYNLARDIKDVDLKLRTLNNDIATRAGAADRSKNHAFRETVEAKLESKIIRKKRLESEIAKYVSWAKATQSRKFSSEKDKKR